MKVITVFLSLIVALATVTGTANAQSADTWVLRLQNSGYDVSVTDVQTPEGTTLNRVRMTGFDSKAAAKDVAQELELDYGTGPLWVGELPSAN